MGFGLLNVASFIDHKIFWIDKVQYGYSKKIVIFWELWKVDLGPFGNKLLEVCISNTFVMWMQESHIWQLGKIEFFCWFGNFRLKHVIKDLVQVWPYSKCIDLYLVMQVTEVMTI